MMRKPACLAVLTALTVVAGMQVAQVYGQQVNAQSRNIPQFEVDRAWPKVPPQWLLGDPSSIGIDAQDNIWVLQRPRTLKPEQAKMTAPAIVVFDAAGNFIKAWGGDGSGFEWPQREHGIHIDHKGFVWVGGNNCASRALPGLKQMGDDQLIKFTQDGKPVLQIGKASASTGNADTGNLHQPADVWVHPPTNELFVADGYGNHRVIVLDADTGAFKRMWGAFGSKPVDKDECPPPSLTGVPPGKGPDQFSIVHAIRVSSDGIVYVADRENRRVQTFTLDGKYITQLVRENAPFARNLALSHDPQQQFLYVGGGTDIVVVDRKSMEVVGSIEGGGVIGGGHQIGVDSKGNLYVAATGRGLQKLTFKGLAPAATR
jgi:DNA-binding beta-propeller fold protein YncE